MIFDYIRKNRGRTIKISLLLLPILLILLFASKLVIMGLLILLSIGVSVLAHWSNAVRYVGIELITLVTVLFGVILGPIAGAIIGLFLVLIHLSIGGFLGPYIAWVIPEYVVLGYLAGFLTAQTVPFYGVVLSVGLNLVSLIFTFVVSIENLGKFLPFAATNVLFNWVMFTFFAPGILAVLV